MKESYNIGLDIGTASVGWAVVNSKSSQVIKKGRKALWGVRLFSEAESAAKRRLHRGTRRRYDRRRERIRLLQEEFKEEIQKVDAHFFDKLKESFYLKEDQIHKNHPLTSEDKQWIKTVYKYPTIYHLRNDLMHTTEKKDIRLVYFALHHIIKYRGNFLLEGNTFKASDLNVQNKLSEIFTQMLALDSLNLDEDIIASLDFQQLESILLEESKNDKTQMLKNTLGTILPQKSVKEFADLICGHKFSMAKLFNVEVEKDVSIYINQIDEETQDKIEESFSEQLEVFSLLKELYDVLYLKKIFKNTDNASISELMIKNYDNHKNDLKSLKSILNYDREIYKEVFRNNRKDTCLYEKYLHNKIPYDEFVKKLGKSLESVRPLIDNSEILSVYDDLVIPRMNEGKLLPKINSTSNGAFPYQINKNELVSIMENQGKYYPFLLEKINGEYKISLLLSFKIPYYVGPLVSEEKSKNAWLIRKQENVKITPYNFDEVINKEATAEKFIMNMTGHCTYLLDQKAMPAQSLLYSEYKVLNELKQIRINGGKLTTYQQHLIIDGFFKKQTGSLTDKKFKNFLYSNCRDFDMYSGDYTITGYSAENKFANNMQSYIDFFGPNGIFANTELKEDAAEEIISWITIFEDKDILANKIKKAYPELEDKLEIILKKKYKGWSKLSKCLLTEKYYKDPETNLYKSIYDLMWETEDNFMQILNNDKYGFQTMIAEKNAVEKKEKINYDLVANLATSPAVKRGIWQALQIVEEIVDYMGYEPKAICIEMARGDKKKERTVDRHKYLTNLYQSIKDTVEEHERLKKELKKCDKIDDEKLFLYFIQEGKCLYTGTKLVIDNLSSYEVDHILPRSIIKDDSIDNKALVLKEANQDKSNNLVLFERWRKKNNDWWNQLRKNKFISRKKFHNLTRKEFKEEDIEGFINRQLVETRQITKHVANILKNYHEKSNVIYLPAKLSHHYREKFELFKFRELNDYHHAHDAYLAAVLGEYKLHMNFKYNHEGLVELNQKLIQEKKFKELHYGLVINSIDEAFDHFDANTGEVLDISVFKKTIENTLYRNDILISKKTEIKKGEFYNQNMSKKGSKGAPLKENYPTKWYGSYASINPSYAVVIKYSQNGKEKQRLMGMPIYISKCESEKQKIEYFRNLLNLAIHDSIEIIPKPIPIYSQLEWDNQICYLTGASDKVEVCNALEFKLTKAEMIEYKYMLYRLYNNTDKFILERLDNQKYEKQLNSFIELILEKIKKYYVLYQNNLSSIQEILNDHSEMPIDKKELLIKEFLKLLNCKSDTANLKKIDDAYSTAFGRKNHKAIEHATVINHSVSGLRTRRYEF